MGVDRHLNLYDFGAVAVSIDNFTGISLPYKVPLTPDVECQTDRETVAQNTSKVLKKLEKLDYTIKIDRESLQTEDDNIL